jgi:DNA-directed RNA polymerase specialized sigma24 family protein
VELFLEPEPLTYREISARLGIPVGSIGPVRGRALRRLRGLLAGRVEAEDLATSA